MRPIKEIKSIIAATKVRSKWNRGVKEYAIELLDELASRYNDENRDPKEISNRMELRKAVLNGADSWHQYSFGACSLVCDIDIAERLLTPTEFKRWERKESGGTDMLEAQARALASAFGMINGAAF